MIICCIGDSLTEGDYGVRGCRGIANVQEKGYPYFLSQMTGSEVRNFGRCGYRASDMLRFFQSGGVDLQGANIVLVMLGTNGGHLADGESAENTAYRTLLEEIVRAAPQAHLFLCTPPNATANPDFSNCGYAPQVAEAVSFVRKLAAEKDLPLIDLASSTRITPETEAVLQPNDGLHFGEEGYRILAEEIYTGIREVF